MDTEKLQVLIHKVFLSYEGEISKHFKVGTLTHKINVLLGDEAVTTPTFQLGSTGSTPGRTYLQKTQRKTLKNP